MASRTDSRVRYPAVARRCALVVVAWAMSSAWAAEPEPDVSIKDKVAVNPYSQLSNEQLGTLAGTFEELDRDQRRWFLTEVRKRMSGKGDAPEIRVGKDDRFGRVVPDPGATRNTPPAIRKPGGVPPSAQAVEAPKVYGTGSRSDAENPPDGSAPLRPEDPSRTRE